MSVQLIDRELDRLESLWEDGLAETYRSYLDAVDAQAPATRPKLALAAALVEVAIRLQGLGGRAAAPPTLLMGDLCLARSSRILAGAATQAVQIAFAQAIEEMSAAAASGAAAPATRELLLHALKAT